MDKEKFLQSGLLEQHVLGLTSSEEEKVVQAYLEAFPELRAERDHLQRVLHHYAEDKQIPVSPALAPATNRHLLGWSHLFLLLATAIAGYLWWQGDQLQNRIETLEAEQAALLTYCDQQKAIADARIGKYDLINDPSTQSVLLKSEDTAEHFAVAYWNPNKEGSWLDPLHLPPLNQGKQYQVWADVDGEMKSIGLVPTNTKEIITLEYLPEATSINITVEPRGGSQHPHVENLTVSGYL